MSKHWNENLADNVMNKRECPKTLHASGWYDQVSHHKDSKQEVAVWQS